MGLDEELIMGGEPKEPVEVLAIDKTSEGCSVYLSNGQLVTAPSVVSDKDLGICHIIDNGKIIELPLAINARLSYL